MTSTQETPKERTPVEATSAIPGWLPSAMMGLLLIAVARQGVMAIRDPDTFWHLRLGHDVVDARSVRSVTGPWSSLSDQQWVPTQWLPEVVLAWGEDLAGLPAVAWLFTACLLALTLLIHRLTRGSADAVPAALATGLTLAAMAPSLSPRPHMLTYIFLAITLLAWLRTIDDLQPRWWLIPLTWLWAMSHGMWFVGPIVGLAVLAGLALDSRVDRRLGARLAVVPLAGVAVAALTPIGPALIGAPFAVAGVGGFITEWQPPSFRTPGPAVAALVVSLVVMNWSRSTRRVSWTQIALLALAVGWILLAIRTVALGAVILSPMVASSLQHLLGRERSAPTSRESWSLRLAAVAIAAAAALVVPQTASAPSGVPTALDAHLDTLAPGAVVFNDYALGGWLRWQHPNLQPVVDGMTEAYSVNHLRDFGRVQAVAAEWQPTFDKWQPAAALVLDRSPIATALVEVRGWNAVAEADGFVLLEPPG